MSLAAMVHACPDCGRGLRPDRTRLNVVVETCPEEHGVFLDPGDVSQLVGIPMKERIREFLEDSAEAAGPCPDCAGTLKRVEIVTIPARGCEQCGSLWFQNRDLKAHVQGVRRRAYGSGSMAARVDEFRDATPFYPAEIVAGILTEYQLDYDPTLP